MALRTKTTRWSFTTNTGSLAASTQYAFPAITVAAELTGRTIRSAILRYSFHLDSATSANITNRQGGVQIDAVAASDTGVGGTIANTGDHLSMMCQEDVTAYFVANFTGASHSIIARWRQVGAAVINLTCELILTYEYEETGLVTAYKTVEIPLESPVAALTAVLTQIGTNQVPLLNDLPEASKTFLDIYFRIDTNASAGAIGNFQLGLSLDAEAEALSGAYHQELITSYWARFIWKRADMAPGTAHAFNARSTVANRCQWLSVTLVVTYSYDVATTTRVRNSIQLPLVAKPGLLSGITNTDFARMSITFPIQEPGTITLQQSGFQIEFVGTATPSNFICRSGAQSFRTYTCQTFTDNGGPVPLTQRIDSGGAQGAGITLARGDNQLDVDVYNSGASTLVSGVQGWAWINYDSDVSPLGVGAHNHTIEYALQDNVATASPIMDSPSVGVTIPETNYYLVNVGVDGWVISSTARGHALAVGVASGFRAIADLFIQGAELAMYRAVGDATSLFTRYPQALVVNEDIETGRIWRSISLGSTQHWPCINAYITYHSLARTFSGNVTGFTGDGSGITVRLYDSDGAVIAQTTTAVGGSYSITCYDNVNTLFARCQQGSLAGSSIEGVAT